jgi:hypothetical protein
VPGEADRAQQGSAVSFLRRLFTRDGLPEGATGPLAADERVLASAALSGGGYVVATSAGVWLPSPDDGPRRIGWHLVSKASWGGGGFLLVEAQETEVVEGAVLLADLPARRLRFGDPGRLPEVVHQRVTASIRSRHHRKLPGGGAWFVQRKVPGHDGTLLQVRADPGTDPAALRQVVADVARRLRAGR